ncbi:MAG: hypothetical protein ACI3Z5_04155 [Paludibacteraceae bacterium]
MKKYSFLLLTVALGLASCSTVQYTSRQTGIDRQNIVASPTVVDIRVDYTKRIKVTSTRCKTQQEAMQQARYMAITKNDIDIVVDPIFQTECRGRRYQVTLTGFAGYYTNSRTFYEDVQRLHDIDKEDIEKYLILHNPEVLKYMNQQGEIVNVYNTHNISNPQPEPVVTEPARNKSTGKAKK